MRTQTIALLFASLACGQNAAQSVDRVFYLTHAPTMQDFQEMVNVIRTVASIPKVSADTDKRTMTVQASGDQIALADWLVGQLDRSSQRGPDLSTHEYTAGKDDVVRVFYLTQVPSVQDFQEMVNTIRTTATIRQAFSQNAQRALVVRATVDQIALASWMVGQFAQNPSSDRHEYRVGSDDVVRVFYLTRAGPVQNFQESANAIRTTAKLRTAFTLNTPRVLVLRGTFDQMTQAEQMIKDLGIGF